eukprot:jgi/Mesvir1/213/Mv13557-RA.1
MGSRRFDVVVLGASGFTGQRVAAYLQRVHGSRPFAIAGRSRDKLALVQREWAKDADILVADIDDSASLVAMASLAGVVISCVGPYFRMGQPVIEACIASETNYVDICGEPGFMESMELRYGQQAACKNIVVVSSCGFDSIPADLGVLFLRQSMSAPCAVAESFLTLKTTGAKANYATYEAAINGFGNVDELRRTRRQLFATYSAPPPPSGPKLKIKSPYGYEPRLRKWVVPFPGADASVVRRSTLSTHQAGPQFAAYFTVSSLPWLLLVLFLGAVFARLASFRAGRKLLLAHPGIFTAGLVGTPGQGPTQAQLDATSFEMALFGASADGKEKEVVVGGPEPGYVATPICAVQSALVILEERGALPPGGVFTPAAAFGRSTLVQRLSSSGVTFKAL